MGHHQLPTFTSISGLVVEYIVAIDVTRVRFPADAQFGQNWHLLGADWAQMITGLTGHNGHDPPEEYASTSSLGPDRRFPQRIAIPGDDVDGPVVCDGCWVLSTQTMHAQPIEHDSQS